MVFGLYNIVDTFLRGGVSDSFCFLKLFKILTKMIAEKVREIVKAFRSVTLFKIRYVICSFSISVVTV